MDNRLQQKKTEIKQKEMTILSSRKHCTVLYCTPHRYYGCYYYKTFFSSCIAIIVIIIKFTVIYMIARNR